MELADVRFAERDGALVAHLSGEVDMTNIDDLRRAVVDRLTQQSAGLVLDLAALDYLDSAGIHLLYDLANLLRTRGQRLGLVVPPGTRAESTLRYAAVLTQLESRATLDDALAVLRD
jgi:anti-anti-sigma factor